MCICLSFSGKKISSFLPPPLSHVLLFSPSLCYPLCPFPLLSFPSMLPSPLLSIPPMLCSPLALSSLFSYAPSPSPLFPFASPFHPPYGPLLSPLLSYAPFSSSPVCSAMLPSPLFFLLHPPMSSSPLFSYVPLSSPLLPFSLLCSPPLPSPLLSIPHMLPLLSCPHLVRHLPFPCFGTSHLAPAPFLSSPLFSLPLSFCHLSILMPFLFSYDLPMIFFTNHKDGSEVRK